MDSPFCPDCGVRTIGPDLDAGDEKSHGAPHLFPALELYGSNAQAANPMFDRLMNWAVGLLLMVVISALVVVQVRPPY
jgi:hypothetical protein